MKVIKKPLTELRRPDRNVRMHTDKQLKEFRRSVEMFGQIRPIVDLLRAMVMEADEASDALLEYGTIEPEQAAAITETREKYAAREEAAAAQAEEVAPAQSGTASSTEPAKRFILCPKCGERIWL